MLEASDGRARDVGRNDAERSGLQKCVQKRLTFLGRIVLAVCTCSVPAFYLWSTAIFGASGLASHIGADKANTFFCTIDPREDRGGQGCENCGAKLLMCPKDSACYRSAVNITYQAEALTEQDPYYQAFQEAALDVNCLDILEHKATDPLTMVVEMSLTSLSLTNGCMLFHCRALLSIFENTDLCGETTCTNAFDTKPADLASTCLCNDVCTQLAVNYQSDYAEHIVKVCGSLFPTEPSAGNSTRRLLTGGALWARLGATQPAFPYPRVAAGGNVTSRQNSDCADSRGTAEAMLGAAPGPPRARDDDEFSAVAPRLLQSADADAEWIVGSWSPCICLMQCVSGAARRIVKCPATTCKGTQPATIQSCTCAHCAQCHIIDEMFVFKVIVLSQCGLSLIVCLSYVAQGGLHPGQLIRIGILRRLVGFFCKNVSPVVSLAVPVTCVVLLLIVQRLTFKVVWSWATWEVDCIRSVDIQVTVGIVCSLWVVQVCLGFFATTYARRAPWLHVPKRALPFPLSKIQSLMRMLGP